MNINWLLNLLLGLAAFCVTFMFSIIHNTWVNSLYRSGIGFILFFLLGYMLRFVLAVMKNEKVEPTAEENVKVGTQPVPQQAEPIQKDRDNEFEELSIASFVKSDDQDSRKF